MKQRGKLEQIKDSMEPEIYLVTKNNKKANAFTYMNHRLEALVGQTIQLSDNFRVKDEA